eukprot:Hpha_TRINITY_DN24682_c0_g1::TRINITY_DN24682_c0_g1_i1::g.147464::m.147464
MDESGWAAFCSELREVQALHVEFVSPQHLNPLLRSEGGIDELSTVEPPRGGVNLRVTVPAPLWSLQKVWGEQEVRTVPVELQMVLPPGYPERAPVEQNCGDVSVSMVGAITKNAQQFLSRELHMQTVLKSRESREEPHRYVVDAVEWLRVTEMHAFVAAAIPRNPSRGKRKRAWLRVHHIVSEVKRAYAQAWGAELGVNGLFCPGQPAMAVVEGPADSVENWVERFTTVLHWGPTPAKRLLTTEPSGSSGGFSGGVQEVGIKFSSCVTPGGAYNGRDTTDYPALCGELQRVGLTEQAADMCRLLPCLAHRDGRVEEAG